MSRCSSSLARFSSQIGNGGGVGCFGGNVRRGQLHGCRVLLLSVVLAVTTSWGSVVSEALSAGKVHLELLQCLSVDVELQDIWGNIHHLPCGRVREGVGQTHEDGAQDLELASVGSPHS